MSGSDTAVMIEKVEEMLSEVEEMLSVKKDGPTVMAPEWLKMVPMTKKRR